MESNSEPGKVLCTLAVVRQLKHQERWRVSETKSIECGLFGTVEAAFVKPNKRKSMKRIADL